MMLRRLQYWAIKTLVGGRPVVMNVRTRGHEYHLWGDHAIISGCHIHNAPKAAITVIGDDPIIVALDIPDELSGMKPTKQSEGE